MNGCARARDDLVATGETLFGLAELEWRRFQLRLADGLFRAAFLLVLGIAGAAVAIAAAIFLASGMRHALARATGEEWAGELGAGALLLLLIVAAGAAARAAVRRRIAAAARRAGGPQPSHPRRRVPASPASRSEVL